MSGSSIRRADRRRHGSSLSPVRRSGERVGDWFVNVEPLADRCRANGWRIEPHSHPHFGQIVFVRGGAGLMTVETDRRPFASPSVLIVPVNTVHGFDYGMDSDGWVLTVAEPIWAICSTACRSCAPYGASLASCRWPSTTKKHPIFAALYCDSAGNVIAAEVCLLTVLVAIFRRGKSATALRQNTTGNAALVREFRELLERRYREGWTVAQFATGWASRIPGDASRSAPGGS